MSVTWRALADLAAGTLFGAGLALSGMMDPARVLGFLDVASGRWDPSLVFVLGGAVVVAFAGVRLQRRMARPLLDTTFHLPQKTAIDGRLILGSALFGAGWGLAGFCPGPAVAAMATALPQAGLFVIAMAAGMLLHDRVIAPRLR